MESQDVKQAPARRRSRSASGCWRSWGEVGAPAEAPGGLRVDGVESEIAAKAQADLKAERSSASLDPARAGLTREPAHAGRHRLLAAACAYAAELQRLNARYDEVARYRHETLSLTEVFALTPPALPALVPPAQRPRCVRRLRRCTAMSGRRSGSNGRGLEDDRPRLMPDVRTFASLTDARSRPHPPAVGQ